MPVAFARIEAFAGGVHSVAFAIRESRTFAIEIKPRDLLVLLKVAATGVSGALGNRNLPAASALHWQHAATGAYRCSTLT